MILAIIHSLLNFLLSLWKLVPMSRVSFAHLPSNLPNYERFFLLFEKCGEIL